jgi:hypothetical protein
VKQHQSFFTLCEFHTVEREQYFGANIMMKQGIMYYCYYCTYFSTPALLVVLLLCRVQLAAVAHAYQPQPNSSNNSKVSHHHDHHYHHDHHHHRRAVLTAPLAVAATLLATTLPAPSQQTATAAWALDMDAFINQELIQDNVKSKLTADEALCRFGQPSRATGEACVRAGLSTKRRPGGSRLRDQAAVDAFGTVDRGDYVRCKFEYELDGKKGTTGYDKITVCSDGSRR